MPACASGPPPAPAAGPAAATVRGDWNDVDAALEVALSRAEMAILSRVAESPDRLSFELLTINDQRARLTVTRDPRAGDQLIPIHLEATIAEESDAWRTAILIEQMSRRLSRLAGVDYAPIGS